MSTTVPASATPDAIPDLHFDPDAPDLHQAPAEVASEAPEISVTVPTAELRDAVSTLRSVAARQSGSGACLSGVRIDVESTAITVAATNLRTTHTIPIPLPEIATGEGMLLLPAALLADALHLLAAEAVTLAGTPDGVVITAGRTTYKICELAKDRYPTLPALQPGAALTLPTDVFEELAAAVTPSASRDETRPMLTHVFIRAEGRTVQALTTDSYRVALAQFTLEAPVEKAAELLVPVEAMERAANIARRGTGTVRIADNEQHVAIEVADEQIVAQRAVGSFPDLAQILAGRDQTADVASVTLPVADLHAIIRRAGSIVSSRTGRPVRLRIARGELTVHSSDEAGSFVEHLPVEHDGETAEVGLSPAFAEEALRFAALSDGEVTVRIARPEDPVLFDSTEARYLLMPIRLTGPAPKDATSRAPTDADEDAPATNDPDADAAPPSGSAAETDPRAPAPDPERVDRSPSDAADSDLDVRDDDVGSGDSPTPVGSGGVVTLPAGDVERRARTVRVDYLVSTLPDGTRRVVELSVLHHGAPNKCFTATLRRVEVTPQDAGVTRMHTLYTGDVRVCTKPVTRFSEKALEAFYAEALAELDQRRTDPDVADLFARVADEDKWLS